MGSLNGFVYHYSKGPRSATHEKSVSLTWMWCFLVVFGWLVVNDFSAYQAHFDFFTCPKYVSACVNYSIFCIKSDWILLECCFKWNFSALASKVSKSFRTSQEVRCVNG